MPNQYLSMELKNGTSYTHVPISAEIAKFYIIFKAGSAYDFPKHEGIAHLLEHLVFKGNANISQKAFNQYFDQLGEELDAYTSKEHIVFSFVSPLQQFDKAVEILCEVLLAPLFDQRIIEDEKQVVMQEIALYEDLPEERLADFADQFSFTNGYGHPILGTTSSLANIDVHALKEFHRQFFTGENLFVFSAGSLSEETIHHVVQTLERFPRTNNLICKLPKFQSNMHQVLNDNRMQKYYLRYCIASLMWSHAYFCDVLLADYIGGSSHSILFYRLREENPFVYDVEAGVQPCGNLGIFFLRFSADHTTYQEAKRQLESLFQEELLLTQKDLDDLKMKFWNRRLVAQVNTFFSFNESMHHLVSTGDSIVFAEDRWEKFLEQVTLDMLHLRWKELRSEQASIFELI